VIALKHCEVEMAVVFATKVVDIPMGKGRKDLPPSSVTFDSNVRDAVVALNGFRLNFSDKDHPINVCEVFVEKSSVLGMTVNFSVHCNFADKNSNYPYSGSVTAIIIADVV
jgi:hypothetical protein